MMRCKNLLGRVCHRFLVAPFMFLWSRSHLLPMDEEAPAKNRPQKFRPIRVVPAMRAITDPPLIPATQVKHQVGDGELVLGVVVKGEARAYPINMLTMPWREIINDTLGDVPIAAMWCHLCHSGIVYKREVNGKTLTFAVSGRLWKRTLVMTDVETGSLWSLLTARAMRGELEGAELTALPSELTTWKVWLTDHPDTTVLNKWRSARRYVKEYYKVPSDFVYGMIVNNKAYHVSLAVLQRNPVLDLPLKDADLLVTFDPESASTRVFSRTVEDRKLTFVAGDNGLMKDAQTGSIWSRTTGEAVQGELKGFSLAQQVGTVAYARAWKAFHAESRDLNPSAHQPD